MLNLVKLCYVCLETDNNSLISVLTRDADGTTFLNKLQVCVATNLVNIRCPLNNFDNTNLRITG